MLDQIDSTNGALSGAARRGGTTQPRFSGGPVALEAPGDARSRLRVRRLVLGSLVMIGSLVGGWLLMQSQSVSSEVWVARDRIEAGTEVTAGDVLLRRVDEGSTLDALGDSEVIVGRRTRVVVPAGSTFVAGHFFDGEDTLSETGLAQMSLLFEVGRVTEVVEPNDLLRVVVVDDDTGERAVFEQVPVTAVSASLAANQAVLITVEVAVEVSDELVGALADGEPWASVVGRR